MRDETVVSRLAQSSRALSNEGAFGGCEQRPCHIDLHPADFVVGRIGTTSPCCHKAINSPHVFVWPAISRGDHTATRLATCYGGALDSVRTVHLSAARRVRRSAVVERPERHASLRSFWPAAFALLLACSIEMCARRHRLTAPSSVAYRRDRALLVTRRSYSDGLCACWRFHCYVHQVTLLIPGRLAGFGIE